MAEIINLLDYLPKKKKEESTPIKFDSDELISAMTLTTDDIAADLVSRAEGESAIFDISTDVLLTELADRINNLEKLCILLNEK